MPPHPLNTFPSALLRVPGSFMSRIVLSVVPAVFGMWTKTSSGGRRRTDRPAASAMATTLPELVGSRHQANANSQPSPDGAPEAIRRERPSGPADPAVILSRDGLSGAR